MATGNIRRACGVMLAGSVAAMVAVCGASAVEAAAQPQIEARNVNPNVLPLNSLIHGKTYGEWGARWWQWAYDTDFEPVADPTGASAHLGQSGQVFLLAGNQGGTTVRQVTIGPGKTLFLPILNIMGWLDDPSELEDLVVLAASLGYSNPHLLSPERLMQIWIGHVFDSFADPQSATCTINGVPVQNVTRYRAATPMFEVEGVSEMCIADGWWLALRPLAPGNHVIRFTGSYPLFGFNLDVTYHLTVAP